MAKLFLILSDKLCSYIILLYVESSVTIIISVANSLFAFVYGYCLYMTLISQRKFINGLSIYDVDGFDVYMIIKSGNED